MLAYIVIYGPRFISNTELCTAVRYAVQFITLMSLCKIHFLHGYAVLQMHYTISSLAAGHKAVHTYIYHYIISQIFEVFDFLTSTLIATDMKMAG